MFWTVHLDGGPRKVNHAAACVGDRIFSFGGYCSGEEYKDWEPIPVHVLNTNTLRWSVAKYRCSNDSTPYQRYGHTVVEYKKKVYMWGGRNSTTTFDKLLCFDSDSFEWSCPSVTGAKPFSKDGHSACRIDNQMYIFGGFEDLFDQYTSDVHCLNLDTLKWRSIHTKGAIPLHRDFHSAVAIGTRMYVFGGRSDGEDFYSPKEEYHSEVVYLDTLSCEWIAETAVGDIPTGRRSHSAWTYNSDMYIFGGYNGNFNIHFNDLYKFSPIRNEWIRLNIQGKAPSKRRRQACLMYKTKMYLFGGTSPNRSNTPLVQNHDDDGEHLHDNSDLHILDFKPSLRNLCIIAVIEYNLDQRVLPEEILCDIRSMTVPNNIN